MVFKKIAHIIYRLLQFVYYTLFKQGTFTFKGIKFRYFYHLMNVTFSNERAIEIPLAIKLLKEYKNRKILEVGNVMHWYYKSNHKVIDKNENGINLFNFHGKYDLVLSISTVEHISDVYGAIEKMKTLLRPNGLLFITMPVDSMNPSDSDSYRNISWKRIESMLNVEYLRWENGYEIAVGYYRL